MSVKQDVEYIKQELDTEEKFLSGLAHAERFWKKFQRPLIGIAAAFIVGFGGFYAFNFYKSSQIDAANVALSKLLANPNDKTALDELKSKDTKLFEVYSIYIAAKAGDAGALNTLSNSKAMFVGELAEYQAVALEKNQAKLLAIGDDKNKLMHDMALIDAGVLALQKNDVKAASSAFAKVPQESIAKPEAVSLEHFSQTAKK
ncbi:MAG: hypothetical protein RL154_1349 [Pseudomonadota bacterium]|jgi:hypothetical protein